MARPLGPEECRADLLRSMCWDLRGNNEPSENGIRHGGGNWGARGALAPRGKSVIPLAGRSASAFVSPRCRGVRWPDGVRDVRGSATVGYTSLLWRLMVVLLIGEPSCHRPRIECLR